MDLSFKFTSFNDFMWMSGHGPYVWMCYGMTIATFGLLIYIMHTKKKNAIKHIKALARRTEGADA